MQQQQNHDTVHYIIFVDVLINNVLIKSCTQLMQKNIKKTIVHMRNHYSI